MRFLTAVVLSTFVTVSLALQASNGDVPLDHGALSITKVEKNGSIWNSPYGLTVEDPYETYENEEMFGIESYSDSDQEEIDIASMRQKASFFLENTGKFKKYNTRTLTRHLYKFFRSLEFETNPSKFMHLDERGDLTIDYLGSYNWVRVLIDDSELEKLATNAVPELEEAKAKIGSLFDNFQDQEKYGVHASVVSRYPLCSEVDLDTFVGLCEEATFVHKMVNMDRDDQGLIFRTFVLPGFAFFLYSVNEVLRTRIICSSETIQKFPKYAVILTDPLCTSLQTVSITLLHITRSLLINSYMDISDDSVMEWLPVAQETLKIGHLEYKSWICVDHFGNKLPIDELQKWDEFFDVRYIMGTTPNPANEADTERVYEYAQFFGSRSTREIGAVSIDRHAKWPKSVGLHERFGGDAYKFTLKHVGSLDRDLLNYELDMLSPVGFMTKAFKQIAKNNKQVLTKTAKSYHFVKLKYSEDDESHPWAAVVTKLVFNHQTQLFGGAFTDAMQTCDHDEPLDLLGFENPV